MSYNKIKGADASNHRWSEIKDVLKIDDYSGRSPTGCIFSKDDRGRMEFGRWYSDQSIKSCDMNQQIQKGEPASYDSLFDLEPERKRYSARHVHGRKENGKSFCGEKVPDCYMDFCHEEDYSRWKSSLNEPLSKVSYVRRNCIYLDQEKFQVNKQKHIYFGRDPLCDIHLDDASCMLVHALLILKGRDAFIIDLGSFTGTYVNTIRLESNKMTYLRVNSSIQFGVYSRLYYFRRAPEHRRKVQLY